MSEYTNNDIKLGSVLIMEKWRKSTENGGQTVKTLNDSCLNTKHKCDQNLDFI